MECMYNSSNEIGYYHLLVLSIVDIGTHGHDSPTETL
jgi:hypothetical protein